MKWLISDFALLAVVLRAGILSAEALLLGGIAFRLLVLGNLISQRDVFSRWKRLVRGAAIALFVFVLGYAAADAVVLLGTMPLGWRDVVGAQFLVSGAVCAACAVLAWILAPRAGTPGWLSAGLGILIAGAVVSGSHAASEVDHLRPAIAATLLHHFGTALWIGAMPFLLLVLPRLASLDEARAVTRRYSNMAMIGVALLLGGGIWMSFLYVGSWPALYGTAYGLMLIAKIALFCVLIALGASNFYLVREMATNPQPLLDRLTRLVEVEVGIGFTVLLAAASLTSQPPARDMVADRLTSQALAVRMEPHVPRFSSPPLNSLSPATNLNVAVNIVAGGDQPAQNKPSDIAWSEYNHHWAGLIVLVAGALALLSRTGWRGTRSARHWPVAFVALAVFILLRADPENWPLGPNSFWKSFYNAEVLQHRLAALLVLAFAWFEWRVQRGHVAREWMRLVFPAICAVGAALLLTHNHALGNVREELLAEYSHTPIAVAGALAGWGRWLELRMPPDSARNRRTIRWAGLLWPVCLMVAGAVLLNYREA